MNREICVFADWEGLPKPTLVGSLRATTTRRSEHFSFVYDHDWLKSPYAQQVDPDLALFTGEQHSTDGKNFRSFLDSCPDRWGRLLMKRREAALARQGDRRPRVLTELDYLLGVHDFYRQGALRFKETVDGPFLDNNDRFAAPPFSSLRELEYAAGQIEGDDASDEDHLKWLYMLMSPGSSLGGARPKASAVDENNHLWIAKFPSRYDDHDLAAWEYVVHKLALKAGIEMAQCRLMKLGSHHHTFLTKRFDRTATGRLHFSSAMTQLGYYDGDYEASYLELAQFLTEKGANTKADLAQLWRRIVFNIAVSNTDDHLRNHGFLSTPTGWRLSPAYDINPVTPANGLSLNISDNDNALDFELAMDVIDFFQLSPKEARDIRDDVVSSVGSWVDEAKTVGLSRKEQEEMSGAFSL